MGGQFPLPGAGRSAVAAPAPGVGPQHWAGASSAALDDDGSFVVAYRLRVTPEDCAATIVARSADGAQLEDGYPEWRAAGLPVELTTAP